MAIHEIKHTHDGIEIEYVERDNKWKFTLRGRERIVDSLAQAKLAIDKPEPKDKPPFERIKAYWRYSYGSDKFSTVEVTSIAASSRYHTGTEVWIVNGKERSKVDQSRVFPVTPANTERVQAIEVLWAQREAIDKKITELEKKLVPLSLPKE